MSKTNELIQHFLGEPAKNLMHAMYDDYVEANVRFRSRSGMKTFIIRRQLGKCCEWCAGLAGIYESSKAPDNIYQRHDNCKCMVTFRNEQGKYTDVWSKQEFANQRAARIERQRVINKEADLDKETRKALQPYLKNATPGKGHISKEAGYKKSEDPDANAYGYILHKKFGGEITFRNRSNSKRKSDYVWNGNYWEHKHVSSLKSADNQTHSCLDQIADNPGGLLIQLKSEAYSIPLSDLERVVRNRLNRSAANHGIREMDVMVFRGKAVVLAFKWQKK